MESVEERLSAREQQLATLYADYWRAEYRIAQGEDNVSSVPVHKAITDLLTDEPFLQTLRQADLREPVLRRRRDLFLNEAERLRISGNPELAALVEQISHEDSAMRFTVRGRKMTRAELSDLIAHNPDRALRREAWKATAQFAPRIGELVRRAMQMRNSLGGDYVTATLSRKGLDRRRLLQWFEQVRAGSEEPYRQLLGSVRAQLDVDRVEPWDLEYYFESLTEPSAEAQFAADRAWPKLSAFAQSLGFDLRRLPIHIKVADISFGGATYPIVYGRDIRILMNRHSGLRYTDTLAHELGHALHYVFVQEPSFLLQSAYSEAFDEGAGQVTALMLYRSDVAQTWFGLTAKQAAALRERYRQHSLMDMREHIAASVFEMTAYDNPNQNLADLYNSIWSRYMLMDAGSEAVWTFDPFFGTEPLYLHNYVLAEMFGRQVQETLKARFSTLGREAGSFLREQLFAKGASYSLDEITRQLTGEALTPRYLIQSFRGPQYARRRPEPRAGE